MQRKRRLPLSLLTIAVCVLSCSQDEADHIPDPSVQDIRPITSVGGMLYFLDNNKEMVYQFNEKKQVWEFVDVHHAYALAADQTTLYISTRDGIYRVEQGRPTPILTSLLKMPNPGLGGFVVENGNIYAVVRTQVNPVRDKLLHSLDGGKSWHEVNVSGHVDEMILNVYIAAHTVYVIEERRGVYQSNDGGQKWTEINQGLPIVDTWFYRHPLFFDKNTVYIGTEQGVYYLPDGETTWMPTALKVSVSSSATSPTAIYVGAWRSGVFRSNDGGQSWQNIGIGFAGRIVTALAVHDNRLYAGTHSSGVYYTDDEGATWHPLNKGLNLPSDE